jgi:hypothetical protein
MDELLNEKAEVDAKIEAINTLLAG